MTDRSVPFGGRPGRSRCLRLGHAAATGLDDASTNHVVSVNTVAIWPDLEAGLDELARVLRPSGSLLLGWHSAVALSPVGRRMALPAAALDRIEVGLQTRRIRSYIFTVAKHGDKIYNALHGADHRQAMETTRDLLT